MARFLTTAEAARACRVKPATIRQWASRGRIRRYRRGDGTRVWSLAELADLLAS